VASISASQGSCAAPPAGRGGVVGCALGSLAPGASAAVDIGLDVGAAGGSTLSPAGAWTGRVTGTARDPNLPDNASSATTAVTGAPPPPPPPPPPPAPPPVRCVVPGLVGRSLGRARALIAHAHCSVGRLRRVASRSRRGTVLAQSPRAGAHRAAGFPVSLRV